MFQIKNSLADQGMTSIRNYFDLRVLFNTPARRYRLMLAMTFAWFGQFSGNNISSYYLPIMLNNVGITETTLVLLLNAIYAVIGWVFAISGARFHDVWGRRNMLMGSCAGMAVCLAIVAGTAAKYEKDRSIPASQASIAWIFIFGATFAFSFTPMQPIYPAEVLSSKQSSHR
jgi:MFS family permease